MQRPEEESLEHEPDISGKVRDMLWALLFNVGPVWHESGFDNLSTVRSSLGDMLRDMESIATTEIMSVVPGSNVVNWGMGNDAFYPWHGLEKNIQLTAIEPAINEVREGQKKGTVPNQLKLITSVEPPYSQIAPESVDVVISHTAFHLLPDPQMKNVLQDLINVRLKNGGVIGHIQDIGPLPTYLIDLDPKTKEGIEKHLRTKYGTSSLHSGNFKKNGGIWSNIHQTMVSELQSQKLLLIDQRDNDVAFIPTNPSELNWPNLSLQNNFEHNISKLANATGTNLNARLNTLSEFSDGLNGLIAANEMLMRWINLAPSHCLKDTEFQQWSYALIQASRSFIQDVFEGYLKTVFQEFGLNVYFDRATVALPIPESAQEQYNIPKKTFLTYIDGYVRRDILATHEAWTVMSMRRIIGMKTNQ